MLIPILSYSNLNQPNTKKCSKYLSERNYKTCYSYKHKMPLFTSYSLVKNDIKTQPDDKDEGSFITDSKIPKKYRTEMKDYQKSKYVTENLFPDYSNSKILTTNLVAMNKNLRENAWAKLEWYERLLAKKFNKIDVVTGAIPSKDNQFRVSGINIPSYFYKIIYIPETRETIYYLIKNTSSIDKKLIVTKKYRTNALKIEKLSGFNF